jgi:hypothetical protein
MKKETIKLTESRLRKLVEACVKEALEDAMEEGHAWDTFRGLTKGDQSKERFPNREEMKDFIQGEPNKVRHDHTKLMYNQSKSGNISDTPYSTNDYADQATWSEPGFKGKAKRAAVAGGVVAKTAFDKGKAAVKKGVQNMRKKGGNDKGGNYPSFTL